MSTSLKPDQFYDIVAQHLVHTYGDGSIDPLQRADELMQLEGFPLHYPVHHFLVPAVLLAAVREAQRADKELFIRNLDLAKERSRQVPGGSCGFFGACGAAVGVGIFWSVLTDSTPYSKETWALANRETGKALTSLSELGEPRCCKRCTWRSIESALTEIEKTLAIRLPAAQITCTFHEQNKESCMVTAHIIRKQTTRRLSDMPTIPIIAPRFSLPKSDPDQEKWCPCQDRPVEITYKESVLTWNVAVGQEVEKDDLLAEYEAEKMTFQLLAPAKGRVLSKAVSDGDTFKYGDILGQFDTEALVSFERPSDE